VTSSRPLTRKQAEVLEGVEAGENSAEMARRLGVTRQAIFARIGGLERRGLYSRGKPTHTVLWIVPESERP
jgi:DNA-binding MarR family transcriptional regulator